MLTFERLESRITPANYFVHGNELAIENAAGASVNRPADALLVGSTGAVLLQASDRLLFDANGDNQFDPYNPLTGLGADRELVRVTAGGAIVFVRNFDLDAGYDPDEVSGLAVSNGFRGTVSTDIQGDVATVLDAANTLTFAGPIANIQFSTIASLTISGRVLDDVIVGNRISNLTVGAGLYLPAGPSADRIATGTATDALGVSFGTLIFAADFTQPDATPGGNIANVRLAAGAREIIASNGGNNLTGNGAAGGSIIHLNTGAAVDEVLVRAGNGGMALAPGIGIGGRGGNIVSSTISALLLVAGDDAVVQAGTGGVSGNRNGGNGGNVTNTRLTVAGTGDSIDVSAGAGGGAWLGNRVSGTGGSISNCSVISGADLAGDLNVLGGDGGDALGVDTSGGKGGDVARVSVQASVVGGGITVEPGEGGVGRSGGAGGRIRTLSIAAGSEVDDVLVSGGDGGDGLAARGGAGGNLTDISATVGDIAVALSQFSILGGDAGHSNNSPGAAGGSTSRVRVTNMGMVGGGFLGLTIDAGRGGAVDSGDGNGGAGGNLSNVAVTNLGGLGDLSIEGGLGGAGHGNGDGGNGGKVSRVTVNNHAAILGAIAEVRAGNGGRAGDTAGDGGNGGRAERVTIHDSFGDTFQISGGNVAGAPAGRSGNNGPVRNVVLDGFNTDFRVETGLTVPLTLNPLGGGRGGDITNVSGMVGRLVVRAGYGLSSSAGPAGDGGSISGVNITSVGEFVRTLMAGGGGNSGTVAGDGGSVANVRVAGDIGNFASAFDMTTGLTGQGGISVGTGGMGAIGGQNGSVNNVRADGISTIIAGRPLANALTTANAATAITNVRAFVVGADVDGDEDFDFTDVAPGGFGLGEGDTAIDGLIVVRGGGFGLIRHPITGDSIAPLHVEMVL